MTGYARIRRAAADGEVVFSIKSVNHRGLDVHFHLPPEFDPYEHSIRNVIRRLISRGHLEVRASLKRTAPDAEAAINVPMLDSFVSAWRAAAARHGVSAEPDLASALRIPGMMGGNGDRDPDAGFEQFLCALTEDVVKELNVFREREGEDTLRVVLERNQQIRDAVTKVRDIRSRAVPAFQARLQQRLSELLNTAQIEPQRLVQEAAILADRGDIGEEIARLEIHAEQLEKLLRAGGEAGKKLDFLLQEMNRETNTMLSKTNGIGEQGLTLTETALAIKADIEKIREQSLNLE
ncbi:MAG: YicC family protein [Acidobacteria bacterium]|nr:YicC family protein [Acidobacteriota bacterium]